MTDGPTGNASSSNPFPYPSNPSPSAHQIFHLQSGATPAQIKARYYELVRCHHPDSHHCKVLSAGVAHARFQSIVAAYDYLRGKTSSHIPGAKTYGWQANGQSDFDPYLYELARRRRARQAAEGDTHWYDGFGAPKSERNEHYNQDGSREQIMLAFGVLALVIGIYPTLFLSQAQLERAHKAAVANLTQARTDARELGDERRDGIRKRVQDMQHQSADASISPST